MSIATTASFRGACRIGVGPSSVSAKQSDAGKSAQSQPLEVGTPGLGSALRHKFSDETDTRRLVGQRIQRVRACVRQLTFAVRSIDLASGVVDSVIGSMPAWKIAGQRHG